MLSVRSLTKIKQKQEEEALERAVGVVPLKTELDPKRRMSHEELEEPEEPRCTIPTFPSPAEVLAALQEMFFVEFVAMGVYDLLMVIAIFSGTWYILQRMVLYLQNSFALQLPSTQTVMHVIFEQADRSPSLFLLVNFSIAFAIGTGPLLAGSSARSSTVA